MRPLLLLCAALVLRLAAAAGTGPGDCSAAIRQVRASMLAKIGALQKDLQDSLVLIKSELRALREANEAGLLDLKNTVAAQSGARGSPGPLVPVKNSPVLKELANSILVNVARIRPIVMAALFKLRADLRSDLRRLWAAVGAAKTVRATCAPSEQLLRRLGNATCAAASKALTGGLAGLARASGRLQARAQSLLSQQLGQQRRQLVAFERRQNATLSRMERALNCSKAPGSSITEITKTGPAESKQGFQLVNAALGKPTTQSSTYLNGAASHAVDGNVNGDYPVKSCSRTNNRGRNWWTVDLGRAYPVHSVVLWNRVDCCTYQLDTVTVWLSTKSGYVSSGSKSSQTQCSGRVGRWSSANPKKAVSCGNRMARYVTVSKTNLFALILCEVEVQVAWSAELFKSKPKPQLVNVALRKKTNQSSTGWRGNPSQAVDGNTNGNMYMRSCSNTNNRGRTWWTVDLGRAYPVHSVVLWNRVDCCAYRLRGFKVWLSTKSGYVSSGWKSSQTQCSGQVGRWSSVNPKITVSCGNQMARYVTVSKTNLFALTLCEVEVQVARSAVPSPRIPEGFTRVTTDDLDLAAAGLPVGSLGVGACAARCRAMGSGACHGFHVSPKQGCSLLTAAKAAWNEKATKNTTVWVRRGGARNARWCNRRTFPLARGRSRYRVNRERRSWAWAERRCRSFGSKLAQISTEGEREFVHRAILRAAGRLSRTGNYPWRYSYHVGLYQLANASEPRGGWRWYPSLDRVGDAKWWYPTEPNDYRRREDRGNMLAVGGLLNDISINSPYPSVCECFLV